MVDILSEMVDGFQTLEHRGREPVKLNQTRCTHDDAWFGEAWYFWEQEEDAIMWGNKAIKTPKFDIYKAKIDSLHFFDIAFNRTHYYDYNSLVEQTIAILRKKTGNDTDRIKISEINKLIFRKFPQVLEGYKGIRYGDNPGRHDSIKETNPRRRIQIAIFEIEAICDFEPHMLNNEKSE